MNATVPPIKSQPVGPANGVVNPANLPGDANSQPAVPPTKLDGQMGVQPNASYVDSYHPPVKQTDANRPNIAPPASAPAPDDLLTAKDAQAVLDDVVGQVDQKSIGSTPTPAVGPSASTPPVPATPAAATVPPAPQTPPAPPTPPAAVMPPMTPASSTPPVPPTVPEKPTEVAEPIKPVTPPASPASSVSEVEKAKSELEELLKQMEAESESQKQVPSSMKQGTVGDDDQVSTVSPAQPTVPTVPPTSSAAIGASSADKPTALTTEDKTDLPVSANELQAVHHEVVDEEMGKVAADDASMSMPQADESAAGTKTASDTTNQATPSHSSEKIDDQNIFFMLGIENSQETEKESFLDELQQVVWEDFLENDAKSLLSKDEFAQLQTMLAKNPKASFTEQADIVDYLEKLVPDLEERMVKKAMKLKEEMFAERLHDLRQQFAGDSTKLATIDEAEALMKQAQWYSAAKKLNQLS